MQAAVASGGVLGFKNHANFIQINKRPVLPRAVVRA